MATQPWMTRRDALCGLTAVGARAVLAVPALGGCSTSTTLAMQPWSGPPTNERDVRLKALAYAVLAPSAHNTQPWLISLRGDSEIYLYVDKSRLLPAADPPFRQTHISQGTFLELFVIALSALAHRADVLLFPEGEYGNAVVEDRPVARVRVLPGADAADPLFEQIPHRRSNKRAYDAERSLSSAQIGALSNSVGASALLSVVADGKARERLAVICTDAMGVEVSDRVRNIETAKWFRYSNAEIAQQRDGFNLENNGKSSFERWFAETFLLSREKSADPNGSFALGAVDLTRDQARSAPAFGVLSTPQNTRTAQVLAGRAYARVALTAQALGLAMHPMSQALEEYADMAAIKARLEHEVALAAGGTVQMLFRLGYADETPHTPRREVHDLLLAT